jgi:hypothetical protein
LRIGFPVDNINEGDEVIILLKREEGSNNHKHLSKNYCMFKAGSDEERQIIELLSLKD